MKTAARKKIQTFRGEVAERLADFLGGSCGNRHILGYGSPVRRSVEKDTDFSRRGG